MSNNYDDDSDTEIKLILVGQAGCGKTSIISRYYLDKFNESYFSTSSCTFITKKFEYKGKTYNINIWDTAGQEKFRSLTKIFIKNSNICLFVYDISNLSSFTELDYWIEQVKQIVGTIVFGIAGNKNDLIAFQQVKEENAISLAKKINATFSLISALKDKCAIDELINNLLINYIESKNNNNNEDNNNLCQQKSTRSFSILLKDNIKPKKKTTCCNVESLSYNKRSSSECKNINIFNKTKLWKFIDKCIDKKQINKKLKIILIGESNVGKTNFVNIILGQNFIENSKKSLETKMIYKILSYKGKYYSTDIFDIPGDKSNREFNDSLVKNSDIILCFYDNKNSFDELKNYWFPLINKNNTNSNVIVGVAENKIDLHDKKNEEYGMNSKEMKNLLNIKNEVIYGKISCKLYIDIAKFFNEAIEKFIELSNYK